MRSSGRTASQEEGDPISHRIRNNALLGKFDLDVTQNHRLTLSHNFDYSRNTNQTFDVTTYGNSANGIEGPSKINVFNANLFSTVSPTKVNEAALHLRARGATSFRGYFKRSRRHSHGLRDHIPLRSPILPWAER